MPRAPHPPVPAGEASLTLAEREVEVARGTAVTRGPLEALPAGAAARVLVTVPIHHSRAGALTRCGRGDRAQSERGQAPRVRGQGQGDTHAGSWGRRSPGRSARSGCPGSRVCTRSVPAVGPCGRRCPGSLRHCSHSLAGGGGVQTPADPALPATHSLPRLHTVLTPRQEAETARRRSRCLWRSVSQNQGGPNSRDTVGNATAKSAAGANTTGEDVKTKR